MIIKATCEDNMSLKASLGVRFDNIVESLSLKPTERGRPIDRRYLRKLTMEQMQLDALKAHF